MLLKTLLLIVFGFFMIQPAFSQQPLRIVEAGKSNYKIVISPGGGTVERKAAAELQKYIKLVSGCTLPIVAKEEASTAPQIIIGNTNKLSAKDRECLEGDGVLIKTDGQTLMLAGGDRKGVLYSVYTFLEEYIGCYAYSAGNITYPQTSTITLTTPLYDKQLPCFGYRMLFFPDAFDSTWCDWRKINYVMEDWGLWVHTFEGLVPAPRYFKTNPKYFALIDGKRDTAQLCPSHPEVKQIIVDHLKAIIKAKPGAKYWSVSPNDNQFYCQCHLCSPVIKAEKSPMGPLLKLVNEVAGYFPGYIITTLAYGYSEKPPRRMVPAKNVMIMLASATVANRSIPLQQRKDLQFSQNFNQWSKTTNHLLIWDYVAKFNNLLLPFPNVGVYQSDIQYFASKGADYLFVQGPGRATTSFAELKAYILAKLMWNKDVDVAAEIEKFLIGYYGEEGSRFVKNYLDALSRQATTSGASMLIFERYDETMFSKHLSRSNISSYKNIFEQAFKVVDSSSVFGQRMQKEYASLLYAELEHDMWEMSHGKRPEQLPKQELQRRIDNWRQKAQKSRVGKLSESGITIDDYYRHYKGALEIKNQD